jgi:flagellar hook-associated protein 2
MADGLDLGVSGLASGFDWRSLIDQLAEVERAPQRRLLLDQQAIQDRKTAYGSLATQLSVLRNRVQAFIEDGIFGSRTAKASDPERALPTVTTGTAPGTYAFHIDQVATAAARQGISNIGSALASSSDVSGVILGDAAFPSIIKAGTFTVDGKQIAVVATDSLASVFQQISTATGGDVTATYDSATDRITLTKASGGEIVLGSAVDTSNFLQAAKLSNNGTATVTSSTALGSVRTNVAMTSANLATAISDGGAGAGLFKVNGVEISYAGTESISTVLKRINNSDAGVTASYDSVNDRFIITNKVTGDIGVALEDVTGNFLAATGQSSGSLVRGKDLLYTLDGGGQLSSHSSTITDESSGVAGLSVAVFDEGDFTVTVATDAEKIKKALTDFIDDYNKVQGLIETNTASSTDAKGVVSAGTLAGESEAFSMASDLRRIVAATSGFLTGTIKRLESIGIEGNGDNNNLKLANSAKLDEALAESLTELESLFVNETDGVAVRLDNYLETMVGEGGKLEKKEDLLERQVAEIERQITAQESQVQANRSRLIDQFVAMEQAQQRINQQLQFLQQRFGT